VKIYILFLNVIASHPKTSVCSTYIRRKTLFFIV
jgi:hypothetical protein